MDKAINSAPRPGCKCDVCAWARRQVILDRDLADNYARYRAGTLVEKAQG